MTFLGKKIYLLWLNDSAEIRYAIHSEIGNSESSTLFKEEQAKKDDSFYFQIEIRPFIFN